MRHSLAVYQSDKDGFKEDPTSIFWMNIVIIVTIVVSFFVSEAASLYVLGAAGVHTALWLSNQRWGMDKNQVEFWNKYQSLPRDYRKALSLTPKYVRELDGRAWSQAKLKVDNIYEMRQQNLQETDLPDDLNAKFAAIERVEKDAAKRRREVEAYIKHHFDELGS